MLAEDTKLELPIKLALGDARTLTDERTAVVSVDGTVFPDARVFYGGGFHRDAYVVYVPDAAALGGYHALMVDPARGSVFIMSSRADSFALFFGSVLLQNDDAFFGVPFSMTIKSGLQPAQLRMMGADTIEFLAQAESEETEKIMIESNAIPLGRWRIRFLSAQGPAQITH